MDCTKSWRCDRATYFAAVIALTTSAFSGRFSTADDWPHWRGPARNDISAEPSGYVAGKPWPNPEPLWKRNVGEGGSSPIVAGGFVYTIGWSDDKFRVLALATATGEPAWKAEFAGPKYARFATGDEGLYSGPSGTPEFDAATGLLYTLSSNGDLHAWNTRAQGKIVWQVNLYEKYGVKQRPKVGRKGHRDYGYTTAPLVQGELLIVEVGSTTEGTLMAFDKRTGERRWSSAARDEAGHTGGPVALTVDKVPCLAVVTLRNLLVVRADRGHEGETVAEYPWLTDFANNVASPTAVGNRVVITAGYNHTATVCLEISLAGGAKVVWEAPQYSLICSPLVKGDRVYWTWQKAQCAELATGKSLWSGGKFSDAGSCIYTADDKLIVYGDNGKLALLDSLAAEYKELAHTENLFTTDAWPHIVLSGGRLYCKDRAGNLVCLSAK